MNDPCLNFYYMPTRNFSSMKKMGFVGRAKVPYNEIFEKSSMKPLPLFQLHFT